MVMYTSHAGSRIVRKQLLIWATEDQLLIWGSRSVYWIWASVMLWKVGLCCWSCTICNVAEFDSCFQPLSLAKFCATVRLALAMSREFTDALIKLHCSGSDSVTTYIYCKLWFKPVCGIYFCVTYCSSATPTRSRLTANHSAGGWMALFT